MFHTPENNAAARNKLSLSISDSDALNVLTPRNPLVDKNSVANVLKNSQGLFSPVYSKRLDYFILEDKIRAHSNKHIINLKDNIALLNTDKQKLENHLISKGFNLEQDATLFLCENDAVNVIYEIINSDIGVLAREKLQKENSARVVIKILTSHLSHKLDGIQYYHRSPESTVMTLCPLEAVTLILENDKENPQSFFCQTVFPMSAKKQQELVEDSTKKLYERMFVKNKMPFRRIFKEYFNRALMGLEDWNVVENYCEHYHNYFAELQVLSTTSSEKNYQRDLSIHFTKCCEIDQSLLDGVIERYLKRYKISYSYRAQLWVVNYNGNVKEYNYYGEGTHLQYHSCYISKVLPFRHFPTVGSPSAVAVKGCKDTQVKKTLERHWVSENPAQKLQSVLKEYYLNTPAAKTREKEQNLHSLRDLLREDGYGMYYASFLTNTADLNQGS